MRAWLFWTVFTLCCVTLLPLVALCGRIPSGTSDTGFRRSRERR